MRAVRTALVALAPILAAHAGSAEVFLTSEKALQLAFPQADSVQRALILPTPDQRAALARRPGLHDAPAVFAYFVARLGDRVLGYAVVDHVQGKHEPIDFLVAVDPALAVRSVEILAYRESRGGEIRRASWRAQFAGKGPASALRIGDDVQNIAGATLSCRALADGVRRDLALLDVLVGKTAAPPRPAPYLPPAPSENARTPAAPLERVQYLMGTTLRIRAFAGGPERAERGLQAAFVEVARLEGILSTWEAATPASQLARSAGGAALPIPGELRACLAAAREASQATGGAFDASVGPLVALWRSAAQRGRLPTDDEIHAARALVGWHDIQLDDPLGTGRLARQGMRIDLGGIGKGFALDAAAHVLRQHAVASALLDFGGQLLALDPPPGQRAWRVDVRDPRSPDAILETLELVDASVSTTADYERGLVVGAERGSHVIDPRTGRPATGLLGVVVVTPDATRADALSTALFVLGPERGLAFAREHGLAALLVDASGACAATPQFERLRAAPGAH